MPVYSIETLPKAPPDDAILFLGCESDDEDEDLVVVSYYPLPLPFSTRSDPSRNPYQPRGTMHPEGGTKKVPGADLLDPKTPQPKPVAKLLRSHQDVFNRIMHDTRYNHQDFTIGYKDRFGGLSEIWMTEWLKATDVTHDDFIPGHRILFFKCAGKALNPHLKENVPEGSLELEWATGAKRRQIAQELEEASRWDGRLTEDLPWKEWAKRGVDEGPATEGFGDIEGEILWDRRSRVDKIFGSGVGARAIGRVG